MPNVYTYYVLCRADIREIIRYKIAGTPFFEGKNPREGQMMKVLALNGSPRLNGNTYAALRAVSRELEAQGIEVEIVNVGARDIIGCKACGGCADGECVFADDWFRETTKKLLSRRTESSLPAPSIMRRSTAR